MTVYIAVLVLAKGTSTVLSSLTYGQSHMNADLGPGPVSSPE